MKRNVKETSRGLRINRIRSSQKIAKEGKMVLNNALKSSESSRREKGDETILMKQRRGEGPARAPERGRNTREIDL